MSIYNYTDYRHFLQSWLQQQPRKGHGLLSQWAKTMRVSTTLLSQVLAGKKNLNHEMAEAISRILGLTNKELDFFLLLVDFDRAGTPSLKTHFKKKVQEAQEQSRQLKNQIHSVHELSSEARALYYSTWLFSGLRNLIACQNSNTVDLATERLKLPRTSIADAIEFMLIHGLLIEKNGRLLVGPQSTYISSASPLAQKHHQNWRIKALQRLEAGQSEDLFYTSPMSLSVELAKSLRKQIVDWIQAAQKQVGPSPSEVVRCLNIDLFEY